MDLFTIWLGAGLLLCLAELVLPGQVAFGLGVSGLLVAVPLWTGLIGTWQVASVVSLIVSVPVIMVLREVFSRLMPGDTAVESTDEDAALEGRIVEVVEAIEPGAEGRVAFGGSTWPAISLKERLAAGQSARLLLRDGLVWVVKPLDWDDDEAAPTSRPRQSAPLAKTPP